MQTSESIVAVAAALRFKKIRLRDKIELKYTLRQCLVNPELEIYLAK